MTDHDNPLYNIVRYYRERSRKVLKEGVTLAEAQEHCHDPNTSSKTADPSSDGWEAGDWFDGYERMD